MAYCFFVDKVKHGSGDTHRKLVSTPCTSNTSTPTARSAHVEIKDDIQRKKKSLGSDSWKSPPTSISRINLDDIQRKKKSLGSVNWKSQPTSISRSNLDDIQRKNKSLGTDSWKSQPTSISRSTGKESMFHDDNLQRSKEHSKPASNHGKVTEKLFQDTRSSRKKESSKLTNQDDRKSNPTTKSEHQLSLDVSDCSDVQSKVSLPNNQASKPGKKSSMFPERDNKRPLSKPCDESTNLHSIETVKVNESSSSLRKQNSNLDVRKPTKKPNLDNSRNNGVENAFFSQEDTRRNLEMKLSSLKCMYTNTDGLLNKRDELLANIEASEPDIIAITEVLPKCGGDSIQEVELELLQYDCFKRLKGRGICIYTRKLLKAIQIDDLVNEPFSESMWCEIHTLCRSTKKIKAPNVSLQKNKRRYDTGVQDHARDGRDKEGEYIYHG